MELYTIRRGSMRGVPQDWEIRQTCKYIAFIGLGYVMHWIQVALQTPKG